MVLILIAVIALIMCFVTIKRIKDKKANDTSFVDEYRDNYIRRRKSMQKHRDTVGRTTNFVTKYNSSEDYREK